MTFNIVLYCDCKLKETVTPKALKKKLSEAVAYGYGLGGALSKYTQANDSWQHARRRWKRICPWKLSPVYFIHIKLTHKTDYRLDVTPYFS